MNAGPSQGGNLMQAVENSAISPARRLLREETHAEHVRLNQHPLLRGITKPDYPMSMYRLVLVAYYHFYGAIENAIDHSLSAQSVAFFGIDPEDAALLPRTVLATLNIMNIGQLVGLLYTIEGSSLGGQVISRHLEMHHGLTPANGARFFYGYGERIPEFWKDFEVFMDASLTDDQARSSAKEMAKMTFAMMESTLDDYLAKHKP